MYVLYQKESERSLGYIAKSIETAKEAYALFSLSLQLLSNRDNNKIQARIRH
jgi:hypothetical protein